MSDMQPRPTETAAPRWCPLPALDRRVLGVLVEKAKTTPDGYPMSTSALRSACNQKSNRYPLMEVEVEDIEEALARLRTVGAAAEVQGGGRVLRYRHYLYEWMGIDKIEAAVMTELLLRGAQTEGELRGRAARMEPISDLNALRPVLASLKQKGLVIPLTPEGRGHMISHALYEPRELEKLRAEVQAGAFSHADVPAGTAGPAAQTPVAPSNPTAASHAPVQATTVHSPPSRGPAPESRAGADQQTIDSLRAELAEVREDVARIRKDLDDLWSNFR